MKSETRFFSKGLSVNLLKRCWPLWACYLCLLLLMLPGAMLNLLQEAQPENAAAVVRMNVLNTGCFLAEISFGVAIVVAMAMFSFLYNARTCGMLSSMPLKRETVFTTAYLTGLLPLLAADFLTAAVTFLLFREYLSAETMLTWLALAVMGNVAFYGFAVFCAMLTGSLFILPLAYAALSLAAFVAEEALHGLLGILLYGYTYSRAILGKFSPITELLTVLEVSSGDVEKDLAAAFPGNSPMLQAGEAAEYAVRGLPVLFVYFLCGILFSLAALRLLKRRNMEYAGDTVAFPVLKPIFKYCMAVGSALVFACFVAKEIFSRAIHGLPLAVITAVLLMAGAFIGYFTAEMLIQKTMHVFKGTWKGLLIVWLAAVLFTAGCRLDVTGYSAKVPVAGDVKEVSVLWQGREQEFSSQEKIDEVTAFHKSILAGKRQNEQAADTTLLCLNYELQDGRVLSRLYKIDPSFTVPSFFAQQK